MKLISPSRLVQLLLATGLTAAVCLPAPPALAASCNAKASSLASSNGGSVLSVGSKGNKCVIKLLIKSGNGPPKRKTFVVSK